MEEQLEKSGSARWAVWVRVDRQDGKSRGKRGERKGRRAMVTERDINEFVGV